MNDDSDKPTLVNRAAEVKAMGRLTEALDGLAPDAIARVLRWAAEAYNVTVSGSRNKGRNDSSGASEAGDGNGSPNGEQRFASLADLYAVALPESEADKTLVAGYWFQFGDGQEDFGAQEINSALKNLGHPIKNITTAFNALKARKPAPVMQLKKSGTSKQARKTFKLTLAGKSAVEAMIRQR
ncbi:MAG: hypothetical protein ABJA98_32060 [Acidobacteriota bacterium]